MSLSKYILSELIEDERLKNIDLYELKKDCRELAQKWWTENECVVANIKSNFEEATNLPFAQHEREVLHSYADHYAEKLIITCIKDSELKTIPVEVDIEVLEAIRHTTNTLRKNVIFASGHLGAVEAICPILSQYDIQTSALINFKTNVARDTLAKQIKERGWTIDMFVVDEMFLPRLRAQRNDPKVMLTVIDAFEKWEATRKISSTELFEKECHLDSIMDRMAKFLDADVYWTVMDRVDDISYKLRIKKMEPEENGLYVARLFQEWEQTIKRNPSLYYEWHSLDLLFNY